MRQIKLLRRLLCCLAAVLSAAPLPAVVSGTLRGVVHDPAHRPIAGCRVLLQAKNSGWNRLTGTDATGEFLLNGVPLGLYRVRVEAAGFAAEERDLQMESGEAPVLHIQLAMGSVHTSVTVQAMPTDLESGSATRTTLISREQMDALPGVNLTNSLRMITEFVPGATVVHDQLHVRGGHQVTWAIDGVPVPNTNIATNVGPQFSPRDMDYVEAQTGTYAADYGDRMYGVFNVATRTGFERDREAELVTTFGNYNQTDDQLSFGDHSARAAYLASLTGYRTDYGLEPSAYRSLHNQASGGSGFVSFLADPTGSDQVRFNGAFRGDFYQVPNDPDAQAAGVRDREREQDGLAMVAWTHTFRPELVTEIAPFLHINRAAFEGGPLDEPSVTNNRRSAYEGGQALISSVAGSSNLRAGVYAFAQQDADLFALSNAGDENGFRQTVRPDGRLLAAFVQEQWRVRPWLVLNGGLRFSSFRGNVSEGAWDPRLGVALTVPRLRWVLRASYARFYQAPPLDTVTGPVLELATADDLGFLALHGERDEQHDFGLTIPLGGWVADFDQFRSAARNFFDHDSLGDSNIFLPLTIARARINGWETSVRSPLVARHLRAHLVFSNQQAEGFGAVTGGLTDFSPPPDSGFYLDHDQRNTLSAGLEATRLPGRTSGSFVLNYGSGFLDGDGPAHLPGYVTADVAVAKELRERLTVRVALTNIANERYQLDRSNTFGGSHVGDPRMVYGEVRWRVHY